MYIMVITEENYQAEWDARTLADAERIKSDEIRYQKAKTAAERLAEEQNKEASAMRRVAGKGRNQNPTPGVPRTDKTPGVPVGIGNKRNPPRTPSGGGTGKDGFGTFKRII